MTGPFSRRRLLGAAAAAAALPAATTPVAFDGHSLLFNGQRELLVSGEIHYARASRDLWPALLDRSRVLGLNCVATYVFWGFHETTRDVYDFSGERDIGHFLDLCGERDLKVLLRIGPYVCAEWNFGGYPAYLRDEPGIAIRTWNRPYMRRVEKYFAHLVPEFRSRLATNGGPVALVQVENEYSNVAKRYGSEGQRYLAWVVELAGDLGVDVPLTTCEGGAPGALLTVNGHSIPDDVLRDYPARHPNQPLLWTEFWPSWYDTWGFQPHLRDARNMGYHLLRFVAAGGAGWNYYMWYGGTNFGRNGMYLQTASYGFDAPLDEYGRTTPKAEYLAELHRLLRGHEQLLLAGERSRPTANRTEWKSASGMLAIELDPRTRTARVLDAAGRTLFETHSAFDRVSHATRSAMWREVARPAGWHSWQEPLPDVRKIEVVSSLRPVEQLSLTHDRSDYCWYSCRFLTAAPGSPSVEIPWGGDLFYLFVDDRLAASSAPPFAENRGPSVPEDAARPRIVANDLEKLKLEGFRHHFVLPIIAAGEHRLDILSVALGMIKGDWQIAGPMDTERKGIWGEVRIDGAAIEGWQMRPGLSGERLRVYETPDAVQWSTAAPRECIWFQSQILLSPDALRRDADFRLNAAGLGKGMLFLNGRCLARYWLLAGNGYGADRGWHRIEEDGLRLGPAGPPTQQYYHVPRAWLRERNSLILFEEQSCLPDRVVLETRFD